MRMQYWPAQNTENEVHDEECAKHYHGHEVHELPSAALAVVDLEHRVAPVNNSKEENEWIFWCIDNSV